MVAPTTFASRSERALATSILRDDFGDTAEKVVDLLLRSEGLRLAEIAQRLRADQSVAATPLPSLHEIKCVLLKLLQHNVLDVVPLAAGGRPGANAQPVVAYKVNVREVLYRLRFPKFIELAKETFGVEASPQHNAQSPSTQVANKPTDEQGEVVMEEVLVHGRVRMDQSLDAMAYALAEQTRQQTQQEQEDETDDEQNAVSEDELAASRERIRATFVEMAKKRFISRVHPLDLAMPEPEQQPDFPLSITRGQDSSSTGTNATGKKRGQPSASGAAASGDKAADKDGITVREKKRASTTPAAASNAIPIELQLMLEADDAQRRRRQANSDSEAEYDPTDPDASGSGGSASSGRATKKRKLASKRAKLPSTRGTSTEIENEGDKGNATSMAEQTLVWRVGVDQLLRALRHRACIRFATENVNAVAGAIVTAMLAHSAPHERERDEPTSFPVSARDLFAMSAVQNALPKDSKDSWRLLLNYLAVMCRDKSGMVLKVAAETFDASASRAGDGGQYVVHMQKIVSFLRLETAHAYIRDKYGVPSARIVKLLLEKRQLEQKTIGELALLPSNDARRRLYELLRERIVRVQEVPKRADHNPAFTFYCWSVDAQEMLKGIAARTEAALCKLRRRRRAEADDNKDLIARADQLVERHDLERFDRLSRALDRLDRASIHLDGMLMLLRDF